MKKKTEKKVQWFEVQGKTVHKNEEKPFRKAVAAFNEQMARERVFTLFGSKNKLKRRNIHIENIKKTEAL